MPRLSDIIIIVIYHYSGELYGRSLFNKLNTDMYNIRSWSYELYNHNRHYNTWTNKMAIVSLQYK